MRKCFCEYFLLLVSNIFMHVSFHFYSCMGSQVLNLILSPVFFFLFLPYPFIFLGWLISSLVFRVFTTNLYFNLTRSSLSFIEQKKISKGRKKNIFHFAQIIKRDFVRACSMIKIMNYLL